MEKAKGTSLSELFDKLLASGEGLSSSGLREE
jgi:hypothetical protein